jgi:hypothetical protein
VRYAFLDGLPPLPSPPNFCLLRVFLCAISLRQYSSNNKGVQDGSQQVLKCVKALIRPKGESGDIAARIADEMRRHEAEMGMLLSEVHWYRAF